jgi:hypothetical protein
MRQTLIAAVVFFLSIVSHHEHRYSAGSIARRIREMKNEELYFGILYSLRHNWGEKVFC